LDRDQEFIQQFGEVVKRTTRDFVDFERVYVVAACLLQSPSISAGLISSFFRLMRDLKLSHQHKTEVTGIAKKLKAAMAKA
jgi:hypothetical protein